MELLLDKNIAQSYKNPAQKARVLTENWVGNFVFCPNCGYAKMEKYPNNKAVRDFYCPCCREDYELKSKRKAMGAKIVDGDYEKMIKRITGNDGPNFFLLNYDFKNFAVTNFLVIPKHFFVPRIIEKRKPLAPTAQRANWVGCNIIIKDIPKSGRIFFVCEGKPRPKSEVLADWKKTLFLREEREMSSKGWLLDVMRCVDRIGKKSFALGDIYACENELKKLHPGNKHIKDKVRQQLQILRDKNYLDFVSRGIYRVYE